jgi:hypothetical protein
MPAGRAKNNNTSDDVPGEGDPDRKRVLNVLAQRRYSRSLVRLYLKFVY